MAGLGIPGNGSAGGAAGVVQPLDDARNTGAVSESNGAKVKNSNSFTMKDGMQPVPSYGVVAVGEANVYHGAFGPYNTDYLQAAESTLRAVHTWAPTGRLAMARNAGEVREILRGEYPYLSPVQREGLQAILSKVFGLSTDNQSSKQQQFLLPSKSELLAVYELLKSEQPKVSRGELENDVASSKKGARSARASDIATQLDSVIISLKAEIGFKLMSSNVMGFLPEIFSVFPTSPGFSLVPEQSSVGVWLEEKNISVGDLKASLGASIIKNKKRKTPKVEAANYVRDDRPSTELEDLSPGLSGSQPSMSPVEVAASMEHRWGERKAEEAGNVRRGRTAEQAAKGQRNVEYVKRQVATNTAAKEVDPMTGLELDNAENKGPVA